MPTYMPVGRAPASAFLKGPQDWLTEADGRVERFLSEQLAASFPEDGFQGEEDGVARAGTLRIETNVVSGKVELAHVADDAVVFDGGGLGRKLSVYRLPEVDWSRRLTLEHDVTFTGGADLPVYVRVTQADGHQAWSSPIYLIA